MSIKTETGIAPKVRDYLESIHQGMLRNFDLSVTPTTSGSSAAAINTAISGDGFTRNVLIELKSTAGDLCLWADGYAVPVEVSVGSVAGTVSIAEVEGTSGNISLRNGNIGATLVYDGTWLAGEAVTFRAAPSGISILGKAITVKTNVDSIIA